MTVSLNFVISYQQGIERDYDRAAEAYLHAQSQSNAQAMFNLGYMHEHGQGLPLDLHLAKRYYDQALEVEPTAKLPVTLALFSLWVRKNYAGTFVVRLLFNIFLGQQLVRCTELLLLLLILLLLLLLLLCYYCLLL